MGKGLIVVSDTPSIYMYPRFSEGAADTHRGIFPIYSAHRSMITSKLVAYCVG